jgi:hypothetical protein
MGYEELLQFFAFSATRFFKCAKYILRMTILSFLSNNVVLLARLQLKMTVITTLCIKGVG